MWVFKFPDSENPFPHPSYGHLYGRSPVCLRLWILSVLARRKDAPHVSHWNGLSLLCRRMWSFKCPCVVKRLSHPSYSHLYGFSPVWILRWVLRLPFSVKDLVHPWYGHWKGFSPVFILWALINEKYMGANMDGQSSNSRIFFATICADMRLFSSMGKYVALQMTFGNETFTAVRTIAYERPLSSL